MSTVPKADTPPPANNAKTTLLQSDPNMYARPTAGGNASGDAGVASGPTYDFSINRPGADPSVGDTQTGPNFGHGATKIVAQPDGTGHPASETGGGTVGDSGPGLGQ